MYATEGDDELYRTSSSLGRVLALGVVGRKKYAVMPTASPVITTRSSAYGENIAVGRATPLIHAASNKCHFKLRNKKNNGKPMRSTPRYEHGTVIIDKTRKPESNLENSYLSMSDNAKPIFTRILARGASNKDLIGNGSIFNFI
jgi:hypothetical protein